MKKRFTIVALVQCFFLLNLAIQIQAQITPEVLQQRVDSLFLDVQERVGPGAAVLVVKDQKVILNKGYGMANLDYELPITPNTVFDLASVSKQFAGYAASLLIEQGKLSEDTEVREIIPEFPAFEHKITVRHLVHHTSGLRDWPGVLSLAGWGFEDVISFEQILRMAYAQEDLNFVPGSEYSYSNTGYNVLVEMIQRVTGQSFRAWTNQHIFQPLGMHSTLFLDNHNEVIKNRATSYYLNNQEQYQRTSNNLTALGSSSLFSTTNDLARWVMHLLNPPADSKAVVERLFQTDQFNNGEENNYAYGLSMSTFRGTDWISHSGSWASFRTYLVLLPAYGLSVVVLNNNDQSAFRIAREIATYYVPKEASKSEDAAVEDTKAVSLPKSVLDSYAGTYKLGPAWYVHLTVEGDQLFTQATNEDKFPMTAIADTVLLIKAYGNRTMTFHKDEQAKVTHMVYNDMICPKLGDISIFNSKYAQEYAGTYFSSELNTWYQVKAEEGTLKLWQLHNGEIELTPAWDDDFVASKWYANSVEFQRDANGKINGFSVWQYRSRNQFFRKIDERELFPNN
ncbi:MAG: serine hydrolase [Bacteroidota bacterium]